METQLKPQDLRIGNIIYYPEFKEHITVYGTSEDVVQFNHNGDVYYDEIDKFSPIPLTEDMLLMMGFEYYKPLNHYRIVLNDVWYEVITKDGCWVSFCNLNADESQWMPRKRIQYVHQLQNLFYALKGQELTIKQ